MSEANGFTEIETLTGSSEVTTRKGDLDHYLEQALTRAIEPGGVKASQVEKVRDIVTGMAFLAQRLATPNAIPPEMSAQEASSVAKFMEAVQAMGVVNPDGSIDVTAIPNTGAKVTSIRVPKG